jgi:superfamily II DNA or RNA helicase
MSEGQDLGFLANAEILFRLCPLPDETLDMKRSEAYSKIYRSGIVKNFGRCGRIAGDFELEVERGGIVLILVTQIAHIYELLEFISIPVAIVKGSVSKEERFEIKEGLKAGRLKGVIATVAWTEGIDIPNLTMVINAAGGKSERLTLQKIGRGLRRTKTKTKVKLIDYMDVGHYGKNILSIGANTHILHKQSIKRWKTYEEQGWKPKLTEHL